MLKELTVKWNRDRGLLETFDPKLELKMLSEEASEFYKAETMAHKLAEYADFQFVLDGTKAKFGSQVIESHLDLELRLKVYEDIMSWVHIVQDDMIACLNSLFYDYPFVDVDNLIHMARKFVIKCNNLKTSKTVDGKVVKNEHHLDPKDYIQDELDRLGF